MDRSTPDVSVIIPTRNRADSLRITLECLASADRQGIRTEIIVVDNGSNDHTKDVVAEFQERIPIRYLYESKCGAYGKSHSLNLALDVGGLGEIIAVLDDDMSPAPDWLQGVIGVCQRWPDKDLFGGDIYTIWPSQDVPEWAKSERSQMLILSAGELGEMEAPLPEGRWFGGNHFWFRARVLEGKRRFQDTWLTEPDFELDLIESGFGTMISPKTKCGHRVQPVLLQKTIAMERAKRFGGAEARVRLYPYRETVKQARQLYEHPWFGRFYCMTRLSWWCLQYLASYFYSQAGRGFEQRLMAVYRTGYYWELLWGTFHLARTPRRSGAGNGIGRQGAGRIESLPERP